MLNQKINCFTGNFMMSIGKPNVIVTGWETATHFFCERFILFEGTDGQIIFKRQGMNVGINHYRAIYNGSTNDELLNAFMFDYGQKLAESDIFSIAYGIMQKKGVTSAEVSLNTELRAWNYQACLMYLKWKFSTELDRLQNGTQLGKLKDIITLIKSVVVDEEK
jgi:hypothetical protein